MVKKIRLIAASFDGFLSEYGLTQLLLRKRVDEMSKYHDEM